MRCIIAAASPATRVRYAVLGWMCALSMITYIDRVCIKQVGGEIRSALFITVEQFSLVFSAFSLSYSLFEVPSGWLGDRMGPRKVLARIVLWWSLFTALTGCVWYFTWDSGLAVTVPGLEIPLASATLGWDEFMVPLLFNSLLLLLLIRFLFGMGEAGAYPNIARALRNWFPYRRRGMAQGLLWMCARWGGALAPLLIGLFSAWFGWRGAFLAFGALGVVWVAAFYGWFRDTPAEHPAANEAERQLIAEDAAVQGPRPVASEANPEKPLPLSWRTMLRSPTLWLLCGMYFCSNAGWCFFITWDVEYYQKVHGMKDLPLKIASGAPLFFGGIACFLGGFITDWQVRVLGRRWGRTLQGLLAYLLGGLLFLAASATSSPLLAASLLCLASFAKDFAMAVSWSTCIDIGHRYSGTVSGFMNMVGNFGQVVTPPLVVWLARSQPGKALDWNIALYYSAAMFLVAAGCWAFIEPRRVIVYEKASTGEIPGPA